MASARFCDACQDMFEVQWPKMRMADPTVSQDDLPVRRFESDNSCHFCTLVWAIIRDQGLKFEAQTWLALSVLWGNLKERFESQVLVIRHQLGYLTPFVCVDFAFTDDGLS